MAIDTAFCSNGVYDDDDNDNDDDDDGGSSDDDDGDDDDDDSDTDYYDDGGGDGGGGEDYQYSIIYSRVSTVVGQGCPEATHLRFCPCLYRKLLWCTRACCRSAKAGCQTDTQSQVPVI